MRARGVGFVGGRLNEPTPKRKPRPLLKGTRLNKQTENISLPVAGVHTLEPIGDSEVNGLGVLGVTA